MPLIHFEELWEQCEALFQNTVEKDTSTSILEELRLKINLYQVIEEKTGLSSEERQKLKARTFGEILLTLTHLSCKENINVFEVLGTALQFRSIENYSKKYDE